MSSLELGVRSGRFRIRGWRVPAVLRRGFVVVGVVTSVTIQAAWHYQWAADTWPDIPDRRERWRLVTLVSQGERVVNGFRGFKRGRWPAAFTGRVRSLKSAKKDLSIPDATE